MQNSRGNRLCTTCGTAQPIGDNEMVFPIRWTCPACGTMLAMDGATPLLAPELADTMSGMNPENFTMLKEQEETHFWFRTRNRMICGLIERYFPRARSFLEIGCGNGAVLAAVARIRTWDRLMGSELHPSGLRHAQMRLAGKAEFVQMDARQIPAQGVFDLIGAFDVIEHIAEDEVVLGQIRDALVPTGGTIITVPQHPGLWSETDRVAHHQRRYRLGELEAKLERAGFEVVFSTSFVSLLLPLMMASRLISKLRPQSPGAHENEFAISPGMNRMLGMVTGAEVWLTLRGMRWPAGGSRVVLARKRI